MKLNLCRTITAILLATCVSSTIWAQSENDASDVSSDATAERGEQQKRYDEFSQRMSNSALIGHFTIDGQDGQLKEERYELKGVTKMPNGDYWLFRARIRYGDHDVTVPLPLEVKWAASTPVITLDSVTVPGLGTFSARVLIDRDRYAGTWQHGEVGGHLFGRIENGADADRQADEETDEATAPEQR